MKKLILFCLLNLFFLRSELFSQTMISAPYYDMTSWDSSPYKSFKITGGNANPFYDMSFRLLWPKNYDSSLVTTTNYPLIVMLHGAGESALGNAQFGSYPSGDPRRFNNDHQLKHQGPQYITAVNNGRWPGFVLFPQNPNGYWTGRDWYLDEVLEIIQVVGQKLKIDPNRIYITGLSAGGQGVWDALARYTNVFAAAMPFSGIGLPTYDNTTRVAHIPLWYFQGDIDRAPAKWTADKTMRELRIQGGTPTYTVYENTGHATWNKAIAEPDFYRFMLRYSKLSIHAYYGKTDFDENEPINARLGISPGFSGYEWQKDGVTIPGATAHEITATSFGSYTVRFRRRSVWTQWSPPLEIKLATPPVIASQPTNVSTPLGGTATFKVTVTGSTPLTYQWQKDGVDITGATASTYSIKNVQTANEGLYSVTITNTKGSVTSNTAKLVVNESPIAEIIEPVQGATYQGGQTISYSGNGTDPEEGNLASSSFTWKLEFHKPTGIATVWTRTGSNNGSFIIPTSGETSPNVFYKLILTVTDIHGAKNTVFRNIFPQTSSINFNTQPMGLQTTLDGSALVTPYTIIAVEGRTRKIGVVSPQNLNGLNYKFSHWLHGGNASQTITVPEEDITYTAVYIVDNSSLRIDSREIDFAENEILKSDIAIFPNPSVNNISANVMANKGEKITFSIFDQVGKRNYIKEAVAIKQGLNSFDLDVTHLVNNTYILRIQKGSLVLYKRFIVKK